MTNKTIFITGGARSGKSSFAEKLAIDIVGKRAYLATAQALDPEMVERITHHRERRGKTWDTFEEPLAVAELIAKLSGRYQIVLLDCLTLWLSNVMARTESDKDIILQVGTLASAITTFDGVSIIVSNEVGLGIVPDNALARRYRDLAGMMNQRIAQAADEVYLVTSGIPMKIK